MQQSPNQCTRKAVRTLNLRIINNFRKVVKMKFGIQQGRFLPMMIKINVLKFTKRQKGCFFKVLHNFKCLDNIKILRKNLREWNNYLLKSL